MAGEGQPNPNFWSGRSVFLTGHTGFVGGWLAFWLAGLGARVTGYSLPPPTDPSFFAAVRLPELIHSTIADVRDAARLETALVNAQAEIVLHLAAQPLVGAAFFEPYGTFTTNLVGTLNVLEAAYKAPSTRAIVIFTTDKVYAETRASQSFREQDPLGGNEPYALSKGAAEFAARAYLRSICARNRPELAVTTVRAGNIMGGGDWAPARLVPDAVRAFSDHAPLVLRMPEAARPWQFVLDALRGVLLLAEAAWSAPERFSGGWNFGPAERASVAEVADLLVRHWGEGAAWQAGGIATIPETTLLEIDSTKARHELGWMPIYSISRTIMSAVGWYRAFYAGRPMEKHTEEQIKRYESETGTVSQLPA